MCICLVAALAALTCAASDEIQGPAADVLSAIREKAIGRVYAFDALISVPPTEAESQFVVRDSTGSVVIRRDFDWPDETFRAGDSVRLRCEIGSTASLPASAFFRSMTLIARNAVSGEARGNWLVTTKNDESANVTRLPQFLTTTNVVLAVSGIAALMLFVLAWNTLLRRHLDLAARSLASCRNDLRNCMWDLRNQTLDDVTMDDAIRRTLAPHLSGASLAVRFAVDRELLSDTTALAILRIIRELVTNAVRHGKATSVKVAGCIENDRLMFSVTDNGCGFDPASAPGLEQGHFGLQGVAERTERLNGELTVNSAPGSGTKALVSIVLHRKGDFRP